MIALFNIFQVFVNATIAGILGQVDPGEQQTILDEHAGDLAALAITIDVIGHFKDPIICWRDRIDGFLQASTNLQDGVVQVDVLFRITQGLEILQAIHEGVVESFTIIRGVNGGSDLGRGHLVWQPLPDLLPCHESNQIDLTLGCNGHGILWDHDLGLFFRIIGVLKDEELPPALVLEFWGMNMAF
jgi:hypothetical protein